MIIRIVWPSSAAIGCVIASLHQLLISLVRALQPAAVLDSDLDIEWMIERKRRSLFLDRLIKGPAKGPSKGSESSSVLRGVLARC